MMTLTWLGSASDGVRAYLMTGPALAGAPFFWLRPLPGAPTTIQCMYSTTLVPRGAVEPLLMPGALEFFWGKGPTPWVFDWLSTWPGLHPVLRSIGSDRG